MNQPAFPTEQRSLSLRDYLAVISLRKWLVALVTLLFLAGVLFLSFRQTPMYQSQAKLVVRAATVSVDTYVAPPNLQTEKELADSEAVAALAAKELDASPSPGELLGGLTVEAPLGTEILVYSYVHPNPVEAQERAQAFAEGYLKYRRQQAIEDLLASSQSVEQKIRGLNQQLQDVEDELAAASDESDVTALEAQSTALVSQIAILQQRLTDLTPPESLRVGQIVQPAGLPSSPVSPDHVRNGLLGLFVGLLLGIGSAFLREHFDDRLRDRDDFAARVGAPVLAIVPRVADWRKQEQTRLVTLTEPTSAVSEAYRTLRTGVLFAASQLGFKSLVVASARAGEGKTFTVANLGVALAQAGKRTIVVSADLRRPRLSKFFDVNEEAGLTNLLAGEGSPWDTLVRVKDVDRLMVLPSGPIPHNPNELLGSETMGNLLAKLEDAADFVVIDSAPLLAVADTITLAPYAPTVLFLADAEETNRRTVELARQQLDQVNARVIGAVLNNLDPSKGSGYGYYGYGGKYGYGSSNGDRSRIGESHEANLV